MSAFLNYLDREDGRLTSGGCPHCGGRGYIPHRGEPYAADPCSCREQPEDEEPDRQEGVPYLIGPAECCPNIYPQPGWYVETDAVSGDFLGPFTTEAEAQDAFDNDQEARAERDWERRVGAR